MRSNVLNPLRPAPKIRLAKATPQDAGAELGLTDIFAPRLEYFAGLTRAKLPPAQVYLLDMLLQVILPRESAGIHGFLQARFHIVLCEMGGGWRVEVAKGTAVLPQCRVLGHAGPFCRGNVRGLVPLPLVAVFERLAAECAAEGLFILRSLGLDGLTESITL